MARRSNEEVYGKVLEVHEKVIAVQENLNGLRTNVTGLRSDFVDLKSHVNDELVALRVIIDGKLTAGDLLRSFGFQLMNNRLIRWFVGAVAFTVVATVAQDRWLPIAERIIHALTGF